MQAYLMSPDWGRGVDPIEHDGNIDLRPCLTCEEGRAIAIDMGAPEIVDILDRDSALLSCGNPMRMAKRTTAVMRAYMAQAGYSNRRTLLNDLYVNKHMTLEEIAEEISRVADLKISMYPIHKMIVHYGIEMRSRGVTWKAKKHHPESSPPAAEV